MAINLFRYTALYAVLNICVKLFYILFVEVYFHNSIGFEAYGSYFSVYNLAGLLGLLGDFGLDSYVTHLLARDETKKAAIIKAALKLKVVMILLFSAVFLLGLEVEGLSGTLGILVLLFSIAVCFHSFGRSVLGGFLDFRNDVYISVLDKLIIGVVFLINLAIPLFGNSLFENAHYFVILQISTVLITVTLTFSLIRSKLKKEEPGEEKIALFPLFKAALPFAFFILWQNILTRMDIYFFRDGAEFEVGYYASFFRFFILAVFLPTIVSELILPVFSNEKVERNDEKKQLRQLIQLLIIFGSLFAILIFLFGGAIYGLIYPGQNSQSVSLIFSAVVVSLVAYAIILIGASYSRAIGNYNFPNYLFVTAIMMKLVAFFVFWLIQEEVNTLSCWLLNAGVYLSLAGVYIFRMYYLKKI